LLLHRLGHTPTRFLALLLGLTMLLAACTPPGPREPDAVRSPGQDLAANRAKQLVIALEGEPDNLLFRMGTTSGVNVSQTIRLAVHRHLAGYDERGNAYPMLAAALPATTDGSWLVRDDGTMQTTYRLRSGVTWHDGTPLTARDFAFAWTVMSDPELPIFERSVAQQIRGIATPDDATLVIDWAGTYPFANAVAEEDLGPLPAHLAEPTYRSEKGRFEELPIWTRELVGVGPYRITGWEPGSQLTLSAYDGFYGGRAKIDTLVFRFILSGDSIVASLLAGSVDGVLKRALSFEQAMTVKESWERDGRRPLVLVQPTHYRHVYVQFREPKLPEVRDVRLRRALMYALDRPALVEAMLGGQSPVAHTFIPPDDVKWDWVKDVAVTYDYDPRRSADLLTQMGWTRGGDGAFQKSGDDATAIPISASASDKNVRELAIIADYWKAAGLKVEQIVIPAVEARDNRVNANFGGFMPGSTPASYRNTLKKNYGPACPMEQTRWVGTNNGCYRNAELDRIIDALSIAIEPNTQQRLFRERVKLETEELPLLPLYFDVQIHLFREGVHGVRGETNPTTSVSWNAAEWDVD
jgi:peptide/nickel transport system substrate-binding protein